jgi:hypothetical protein
MITGLPSRFVGKRRISPEKWNKPQISEYQQLNSLRGIEFALSRNAF